jgi:hypothetical protein
VVKCSEVLQCSDVFLVLFYRCVYGCTFCLLLLNSVSCVFLLLYFCILFVCMLYIFCFHRANWHSLTTLTEVLPCFFLSCKANARIYLAKTGHGVHSSKLVNCVLCIFCVDCVILCIVCV